MIHKVGLFTDQQIKPILEKFTSNRAPGLSRLFDHRKISDSKPPLQTSRFEDDPIFRSELTKRFSQEIKPESMETTPQTNSKKNSRELKELPNMLSHFNPESLFGAQPRQREQQKAKSVSETEPSFPTSYFRKEATFNTKASRLETQDHTPIAGLFANRTDKPISGSKLLRGAGITPFDSRGYGMLESYETPDQMAYRPTGNLFSLGVNQLRHEKNSLSRQTFGGRLDSISWGEIAAQLSEVNCSHEQGIRLRS